MQKAIINWKCFLDIGYLFLEKRKEPYNVISNKKDFIACWDFSESIKDENDYRKSNIDLYIKPLLDEIEKITIIARVMPGN